MTDLLLTTFRFELEFNRVTGDGPQSLGDGGFAEINGLEIEMDVKDLDVGGQNTSVVRRIGRAKYSRLICKRGMFGPAGGDAVPELWQWFQDVVGGVRPVRRYDGTVIVQDQLRRPMANWQFFRALPVKIVGPQLNAKTGEVAIEELHLAHEGLVLAGTT